MHKRQLLERNLNGTRSIELEHKARARDGVALPSQKWMGFARSRGWNHVTLPALACRLSMAIASLIVEGSMGTGWPWAMAHGSMASAGT